MAVLSRLGPQAALLDAGCGPWLGHARMHAGECRLAVGMDREPLRPEARASGARAVRGDLAAPPFAGRSFDVIVMRSVMEHLADPEEVLRRMAGMLRPGGVIVALAPSRWYYASLVGRAMPEAIARRILRFVFGETVYDNFPTYYRANTPRAVARLARAAGLEMSEAAVCPHPPDYLKFSPLLFRLGIAYDRAAGAWSATHVLQASFLYVLRKP